MSSEQAAPFPNNWAYLRTELSWLDRMLMLAVSRQRKDTHEVNRIARTPGDKVTSHWWKGMIALNQPSGYDDCRPPSQNGKGGAVAKGAGAGQKLSYHQQMEIRIRASQQQGIVLALPWLQQTLNLSLFEKNVILLALAPEVNRRFGRIYSYLQQQNDDFEELELPSVDLCLRLLCRNDQEWSQARTQMTSPHSLIAQGILEWVDPLETTLLSRYVRVTDDVAAYLLAERPDSDALRPILETRSLVDQEGQENTGDTVQPALAIEMTVEQPEVPWQSLVLPAEILTALKTVMASVAGAPSSGRVILLAGEAGTGKTTTARTLAAALQSRLYSLDLAAVPEMAPDDLLPMLVEQDPPGVLLLKSAQHWLGRNPTLEKSAVHYWLEQRQQRPGLTVLTVTHRQSVLPSWQRQLDGVITLPFPDEAARRQLWRQSLPTDLPVDRSLRWTQVARQLALTGGEITTVAQKAMGLAQGEQSPKLTLGHLQQALALSHPHLTLRAAASRSKSRK